MHLHSIFFPELATDVMFKVLDPAEANQVKHILDGVKMGTLDYKKRVIRHLIYNLHTDVYESLYLASARSAEIMLNNLYVGCIMLNPFLDPDLWAEKLTGTTQKKGDLPPQNIAPTPMIDLTGIEDDAESFYEDGFDPFMEEDAEGEAKKNKKGISKTKVKGLRAHLKNHVIGQEEAVTALYDALLLNQAGLRSKTTPIGVFLFAGASGVGKTLIAKKMQEYLFGKAPLVRIDCGEFQNKHENQKILGCFAGGTQILMGDGTQKPIEDVKVGDEVVTHLGRRKKVVDTYRYNTSESMAKITMSGIPEPIISTLDHEYRAIQSPDVDGKSVRQQNRIRSQAASEENLDWYGAKTLKKGDWVAAPRYAPSAEECVYDLKDYLDESSEHGLFTRYKTDDDRIWAYEDIAINRFIPLNADLAELLGYYVSEGGSSKALKHFNFTMHATELDNIDRIIELVESIFGATLSPRLVDRTDHSSWRVYFHSRIVTNFLARIAGKNTYEKKIPLELISASDKIKYKFLESAIIGDGCTKIPGRVDYSTVSPDLASQMATLCRSLSLDVWQINEKGNDKWKQRYRIYISGSSLVDLAQRTVLDISAKPLRAVRGIRSSENYVFHRVEEVEFIPASSEYVYDISVEDDVSYCVESIAVHNSPPGYVGHGEGSSFFSQVRANPHTVILLDEAEKAHVDFWDTFLHIFSEGYAVDNEGDPVDFTKTIIIMTTNLGNEKTADFQYGKSVGFGADDSGKQTKASRALTGRNATNAIRKYFRPEFINRLDEIIVFNQLSHENLIEIAQLEVYELQGRLDGQGVSIEWDDAIFEELAIRAEDFVKGARDITSTRTELLDKPIAKLIVNNKLKRGMTVSVNKDFELKCYG